MKYLAFTILIIFSVITFSLYNKPTHESIIKDRFKIWEEATDVLGGIKDEASAKAADKKLYKLGDRMVKLEKQNHELGELSEETRQWLHRYVKLRRKEMDKYTLIKFEVMSKPELAKHIKGGIDHINGCKRINGE